ncbi:MAG: carboxypeptidase regulatory-like domain-containing protein, partial [Candidatus Eremiobacteraeota bacterium]|nr:carboxypeptidase regulatory-like domain-containing protein [Candidatus Eremiobacteraeota bacterium]
MNRTLMALAMLCGVGVGLPAQAQVALTVGSVRDQHGAAIAGARVSALTAAGRRTALTDTAGTFALYGDGVASIVVACRYCAPATFSVTAGQPVVAIVRRYDALVETAPSAEDLASLPYAHVESAVALRPFTLLRQTAAIYPGSQLSDRGLQPANALLLDAGVADYDVTFAQSPYTLIPAQYEQTATVLAPSNAFLYGDQAGSGIVALQPFGGTNADVALLGSESILRFSAASNGVAVAAGSSSDSDESRQRADVQATIPLSSAQNIDVNAGSEQGRQFGAPSPTLAGSFSFANAVFNDVQPTIETRAAFSDDRGDYDSDYDDAVVSDLWSDAQLSAGVRTRGPVAFFADIADRLSTGIYDPQVFGAPRIGATLEQNRVDAGIDATGTDYAVTAGVGLFGFAYHGGTGGTSFPSSGRLATPSLSIGLFPSSRWSARLEASDSFNLPTFWEQYGYGENYGTVTYERAALYAADVSYTDESRLRVSLEQASQQIHGYTNGSVSSSGASLEW